MLKPALPRYDLEAWKAQPFPQRLKMVCQAWAEQGYGSPISVYALYVLKIAAWIAVWLWSCTFTEGHTLSTLTQWWSSAEAFQKLIVWTMLFEGLGFGCGSGPLTARYVPPMGGALYFLRPGTTKLPLIPGIPVLGGSRRTLLDVALYALQIGLLVRALIAPEVTPAHLVPILVVLPLLGVADKTIFLAHRAEHYLSAMVCLCFPADWIAGNKAVWMAVWWWAATSKVNHHFPAVMCVMTSNAPWTRFGPLRRMVYRDFPEDLRPSVFARFLAHFGTVAEYAFPLVLLLSDGGTVTLVTLVVMTGFHLFIVSQVPMGVPLEWNFVMIYGGWVLFGVHVDVSILSIHSPVLMLWLVGFHLVLPLYGSFFPSQVSFLLAMRYYAGNWAFSVWLFERDAAEKLDEHLVKWSKLPHKQLAVMYDQDTITALLSKVMAFRAMHLHGRALKHLIPRAVDDIDAYEWLDGELIAGMVVGWNFGDGHLHDLQLLHAIQEQCDFAPGELRCIFVESEPLFGGWMAWKVADAALGVLDEGELAVSDLKDEHPWPDAA